MSTRLLPSSAPPTPRDRLQQILFAGLDVGAYKTGHKNTPPRSSWWTTNGNAFLWLVADGGVAGLSGPAVLLIGEKSTKSSVPGSLGRMWNVPGGGAKSQDNDNPELTALREFTEETGVDVASLMKPGKALAGSMLQVGYVSKGKRTHYYILRVPGTAEMVSAALRLKEAGSANRLKQMDVDLSNETKGWVWVTKGSLVAASKPPVAQNPVVKIGKGYSVQLRKNNMLRSDILKNV